MVQDYRLYLISRHTTEPPSRARAQVVDGSRRDLNGGSVGIVASHTKYHIEMFSRDNSKFQPNSRSFVTHSMASVINLLTHSRKNTPSSELSSSTAALALQKSLQSPTVC